MTQNLVKEKVELTITSNIKTPRSELWVYVTTTGFNQVDYWYRIQLNRSEKFWRHTNTPIMICFHKDGVQKSATISLTGSTTISFVDWDHVVQTTSSGNVETFAIVQGDNIQLA